MAVRADDVDLERDRDLVQRYQAGDPGAFDDLYRRYFARLHSFCQRRVGDRVVAEDLAQEAFERALRAMPSFAGERRFYPWMTVIAQRLCIDHHRRRVRVEPAAEIDLGAVEPDHDALFAAVDREHLVAAMQRLAPRHREVLALREAEGLSYQEIAEVLAVPVSTVEALLHRARKALRREFRSVAGSNNVLGIPLLGVVATRVLSLRARLGDRVPELAAAAAPAAAAVVTAAMVLAPGADRVDVRGADTPRRAAVQHTADTTPNAPAAPLDPVVVDGAPAPTVPPAATAAPPVAPTAPTTSLGEVHLYTGSDKAASKQKAESMPTVVHAGEAAIIGADPTVVIEDLAALALGTPPADDAEG